MRADLWLTDPPYNVNVSNSQDMKIANDNMDSQSFKMFLEAAFAASYPQLKDGAPFYVWFATKEYVAFQQALEKNGLKVRQELIWNKNHFVLGHNDYHWKHEPCLYGWKDGAHYFCNSRKESTVIPDSAEIDVKKMKAAEAKSLLEQILKSTTPASVIDCDMPTRDDDHPTMKPVKLFGYLIQNSSKAGDNVLDTFGGSGTTLIAAEQLGRKAYLMELDPHYCDVIIARWEKLTGREAQKIN